MYDISWRQHDGLPSFAAGSQLCGPQGCSQPHRGLEQVQAVRQGGISGAGRWASPPQHPPGRSGLQLPSLSLSSRPPGQQGNAPALGLRPGSGVPWGLLLPKHPHAQTLVPLLIRCVGVARTHRSFCTRTGRLTDKWEKHLLFSVEDVRSLWKWREACSKSQKFRGPTEQWFFVSYPLPTTPALASLCLKHISDILFHL